MSEPSVEIYVLIHGATGITNRIFGGNLAASVLKKMELFVMLHREAKLVGPSIRPIHLLLS